MRMIAGVYPLPRSDRKIGPIRVLGNDLNLIELELDGGLTAEHGHDHADRVLIDVDTCNSAGEGGQRTIQDPHGIAHSVVDDDLLLFHTHGVDFVFGQGSGIVAGRTDEAGDAADVPDNMPGIITVNHLHQHITGIDLAVIGLADAGFGDLGDGLQRNGDGQDLIVEAAGFHGLLDGGLYSVFITGIGMHYIPSCSICHDLLP